MLPLSPMLDARETHLENELYEWPSIHELSPRSTSAWQVMSQFPRLSMHDMIVDPTSQAQSVCMRSASRASLTGLIPLAPISPPSIPTSFKPHHRASQTRRHCDHHRSLPLLRLRAGTSLTKRLSARFSPRFWCPVSSCQQRSRLMHWGCQQCGCTPNPLNTMP